jgi:prepilin-type N-terminal cleavage/methylation domain-containing protein
MTVYTKKGFTLIELLIVMAILGVLAVVVLVAINPVQQLARTRDSGRKSTITQVGHAMEAFFTAHNGSYMSAEYCQDGLGASRLATEWLTCLVEAGEMSSTPSPINNSVGNTITCDATAQHDGFESLICYSTDDPVSDATVAVIYTVLESQTEESKCPNAVPFFIWSTEDGRGGTICLPDTDIPGAGTSYVGLYLED